ncbi:MAG TPA: hypothetical protein VHT03_13085 [Rhizomicrobium sp.]|jgi:hypothetical protein|nr:hypothetical protein [Rhizomicrobium sp.]
MRRIDFMYVAIGIIYLIVGMVLGIVMGTRQDFQLAPVHAHINLVGFVSNCVFGLVHRVWPALRTGMIANVQFWVFVIGTPLFVAGIATSILGGTVFIAVIGAILVLIGAILFFVMLLRAGFAPESA